VAALPSELIGALTMAEAPTTIAPERLLLFCPASDTDSAKAGVTHSTAQHLLFRNLVGRDLAARSAPPTVAAGRGARERSAVTRA